MPKNRTIEKRDGLIYKHNVASKLRIGDRKSGTAAHLMSDEALQAVLNSKDKKKDHANARTVLRARGYNSTPDVAADK